MLPLKLRILKRVDRHFGRWLCRTTQPRARFMPALDGRNAWQAPPVPPDGIERILVIRPGGIGDAVLMFPMLAALRAHFRDASIDVLGERRNTGVYAINSLVRRTFRYDEGPLGFLAALHRLQQQHYQVVIDTEQYHYMSTVVGNWLQPDYFCGFDTVGRGRLHTHRVRYRETVYEVYSFLSLAAELIGRTIPFDPDTPFINVDPRWCDWADQALADHQRRPIAVIVPGASTPHKYWPPARYAAVADWLVARGFYVVVLGGRDALTFADVIAARHSPRDVLNLAARTSLAQTAGIVRRAAVYLSSDTGALHIAYGVGTPTVHMFGSGAMEKWAPQGKRYVVINKGLPCSPCTRYGYTPPCPYGVACMDAIGVQDVIAAIEEVIRPATREV